MHEEEGCVVEYKFGQGVRVKDIISGYEGVVTGMSSWITGCNQYSVSPGLDDKGEFRDNQWLDEDRLRIVDGAETIQLGLGELPGGPRASELPDKA